MMHFFRTPKIVIDAFTHNVNAIEIAPVDYASNHLPSWWKALPKQKFYGGDFFPNPTMKTCAGMYQYYNKSLVLPMWSELHINVVGETYAWQYSDRESTCDVISSDQFKGFFDTKKVGHLKLTTPWAMKTKQSVNWLMTQPVYSMDNQFEYMVCPGVLDFSKQHATNVQALLNLTGDKLIKISPLTPIALFTPLTDKRIELRRHLVSLEEYNLYRNVSTPMSFINKYLTRNKSTAVCPYQDHIRKNGR